MRGCILDFIQKLLRGVARVAYHRLVSDFMLLHINTEKSVVTLVFLM